MHGAEGEKRELVENHELVRGWASSDVKTSFRCYDAGRSCARQRLGDVDCTNFAADATDQGIPSYELLRGAYMHVVNLINTRNSSTRPRHT
jgi:hypothetical protein